MGGSSLCAGRDYGGEMKARHDDTVLGAYVTDR
jgi:hypothetical protein